MVSLVHVVGKLFGLWECCSHQWFHLVFEYTQNSVKESNRDASLELYKVHVHVAHQSELRCFVISQKKFLMVEKSFVL